MNAIPINNPSATGIAPEWITVKQACEFAQITKPVLYQWMRSGLIRNFSNRQRGQVRGARRISFDSLREFMDSRATGGATE